MAVCPGLSELEDFLSDRLQAERESWILAHLESCAACQKILEGMTTGPIDGSGYFQVDATLSVTVPRREKPYPLPQQIGQYNVIRELGHGGMGVVYLAEQTNLKRQVALKVIRHGVNATAQEVTRFCAEAEAVAQLQHPNIVHILEVGSQEGIYYLALEYVNGGSLDRQLASTPQDAKASAQLLETLARAVQHAHLRGILHRDLKPANVLLQLEDPNTAESTDPSAIFNLPSAIPKITDFGLAKRLEAGEARTQSGLVLGTPSYMAPEQASAKYGDITAAVDVYGLGALLYEMLAGRPPFKGATPLSTLEQLVSQEPVAPSRFYRHIPTDLETICLKCLEKEPRKRYPSAEALADDLRRFCVGQPIVARPIRVWGRLWKWARRRPLEACLAAAVILVAVLGLAGIVWQWRNSVAERDQARQEWYRANIASAASALQLQNSLSARRSLEDAPAEFRNWEWRHFHSQLENSSAVLSGHQGPVLAVAFSSDGKRLVSASQDQTLRLWDTATGREIAVARGHQGAIEALAFSPDGTRIASGSEDSTIRLWDAHTGAELGVCRGHSGPVRALAFSPDGNKLVSGGNAEKDSCCLWDTGTCALITLLPARATTHGLAFTPDGALIAACRNDDVRVLSAVTGKEIWSKKVAGAAVFCSAISRDGRHLVTGWDYPDCAVRVWDIATGELLAIMNGHQNRVGSVAFNPDGTGVVSASQDQTVRIWDTATGKPFAVLRGHTGHAIQALFNPDGTRVVSCSFDGTLRLWNPATGELISVLRGHTKGIGAFAFSPDGARLASASSDHTVRLWDLALVERNGVLRGHQSYVYDVAFSPDGVHIGSAAWDNTMRLWDADSGRQTALFRGYTRPDHEQRPSEKGPVITDPAGLMLSLAFSPDGAQVVTGSRKSKVQFWDVKGGELRNTVQLPGNGVDSLAFSPDGKLIAAALGNSFPGLKSDSSVLVLDAQTSAVSRTLTGHTEPVLSVRFAPGGRRLASGGFDKSVRIWDAATGEILAVLTGHGDTVACVAFSADGNLLASGSLDRTVRLWNARTFQPVATLQHASTVYALAFSPDGTRLAAGCDDNTIRLWDVAMCQEVAELRGHEAYVHAVAFSPDGTRLVSASGDFTVRVWDTLSPQERSGKDGASR